MVRGRFAELAPRIYRALGLRQRQAETNEDIAALARMFAVSPLAMRIRLEDLNLIQQETAARPSPRDSTPAG